MGDAINPLLAFGPTSGGQSLIRFRFRSDAWLLAALAAGLLVWFAGVFVLHGFRFPVGPDVPVYLWWTRLAGAEGLSTVERPGTIALLAVLRWTGVGLPAAVAGAECALAVTAGVGGAMLARAAGASRTGWMLAGALAGTFATHLAAGYVSNLAFVVVFVAALVVLDDGARRSVVASAVLLGAGGLAHPLFFFVGVTIVVAAAVLAYPFDHAQAWRAVAAALGAAALAGIGWLALLVGPPVLHVDTSQDAFLRRAGLGDTLAHAYRDRLIHRWTRYVEWASIPLAVVGAVRPGGWVRRSLWAWLATTVVGVVVGLVTAWFPPDRFITFGYAIPILAALGLVALVERWHRRAAAVAVATALALAMVAGAGIAWFREKPYLGTEAVHAVATAAGYASSTPPGTPWVFPVDSPSTTISFLATRLQNVIRATVPPERIADVYVVVPPPPPRVTAERRREWSALARLYASDAARAAAGGGTPVVIDVAMFRPRLAERPPVCAGRVCGALAGSMEQVGPGVSVSATAAAARSPADTTLDSSTGRIALAAPLVLALLVVAGFGWSSVVGRDPIRALGLAPAFGTAALVLGGVIADRLGLRLDGAGTGLLVLGVVSAGGYAALLSERRRRPDAPPQLER